MDTPEKSNGKKSVISIRHSDDENSDHENERANGKDSKLNAGKPKQDDEICELEHLRKLFIGGLAPYTTEENLRAFYGHWGNVVDAIVMRDPTTKRSRGFGFITYTKASMVDKAQDNRPHVIDGKTVEAKRALPRPERESRETNITVKKLFVGGLKDNHDEECLQEYFSNFGNVISVKILTDKTTGKRRGFAFIEFDDYDAVDKAILQKTHSIKYVVVDVKKSVYKQDPDPKDQHRQHAEADKDTQMEKAKPNGPPSYRPPAVPQPPPQTMPPPYQQAPPMNGGQPPPPPPNYNYWGQPPPAMPYGYQQPQPNGWNYPPAPNAWHAGPPPPAPSGPMPNSWHPQQQPWGGPPPAVAHPPQPHPQMIAPPGAVGPPSAPNWNAPIRPSAPPALPPPQQPQQMPSNFGTGYQQNYGGGPSKHNVNTNRMNPYSAPPNMGYGNQPPANVYGNYPGPPNPNVPAGKEPRPVPKPMQNGAPVAPPMGSNGNKYRR